MSIKRLIPKLPEKKYIALILFLSILWPLVYYFMITITPEGYVFTGLDYDDLYFIATMNSVKHNFENPWSVNHELIFFNPSVVPFTYVSLGFLGQILLLDHFNFFVLSKGIFAFFYFIASYYLIKKLSNGKNEFHIAFIMYSTFFGIFIFSKLFFTQLGMEEIISKASLGGYNIVAPIHHASRIYYSLPIALGFLTILFILRNSYTKYIPLFLGIVLVMQPHLWISFILIIFIYFLSERSIDPKLFSLVSLSAIFALPWIFLYSVDNTYLSSYTESYLARSIIYLPILILSLFPIGLFAFYYLYKKAQLNRKAILLFMASTFLFLIQQTSRYFLLTLDPDYYIGIVLGAAGKELIPLMSFMNEYGILFELQFLFFAFLITKKIIRNDKKNTFILLWFLILFFISLLTPYVTFISQQKLLFVILLPFSIIASRGLILFSERFPNFNQNLLIGVVALISVLSLFYWFDYNNIISNDPKSTAATTFLSAEDSEALKFLKSQSYGSVLSSIDIGLAIPYYADKKAVLGAFFEDLEGKKEKDYTNFLFDHDTNKTMIIRKYNITYVFIEAEKSSLDIELPKNLELIYNNITRIYRINN